MNGEQPTAGLSPGNAGRGRKPSKLRWILPGVLILLSGIVIGAGGTAYVMQRKVLNQIRHPVRLPNRFEERLTRGLNLTPEQKAAVEEIVRRHSENLQRIREESVPRIREEMQAMQQEILDALDEEQAAVLRHRFDRVHRRFPSYCGDWMQQERMRQGPMMRRRQEWGRHPDGCEGNPDECESGTGRGP